jgi:ABC-type antimicrobial peptide transport system permease subunit
VLAYVVAQRAREFAIRIALGGTVRDIFDLVIREGALLTGIGLALGMAGNAVLTGGIEQWLYQVRPLEPAILIVIAVAMGAIALLACAVPARRATSINPAAVLNQS